MPESISRDQIGDHRKSEAERRADHLARCAVCREIEEGAAKRKARIYDAEVRRTGPGPGAVLDDAMADRLLRALTTWRCDRCGDEATGGLRLPETWSQVRVGTDRLDLCPACALSLAAWLEHVGG